MRVVPTAYSQTRTTLSLSYKMHIVQEAREIGNIRSVARKFCVQPSQIRRWSKKFAVVLATATINQSVTGVSVQTVENRLRSSRRHRISAGGRKALFDAELIRKLKVWAEDRRKENKTVSMMLLRLEAKKLAPSIYDDASDYAIRHRIYRLLKKWEFSYRRKTHKAQNTRICTQVKESFVDYFNFKINLLGMSYDDVFNVDQTNVPFSLESTYTYDHRGRKTVSIQGAVTSSRATAMIGTNASGTEKIPPFLIYKGSASTTGRIYQELRKREGYPAELEYGVQKSAWMDEELMLQWLDKVWKPVTEARQGKKTLLLLDVYAAHMTSAVMQVFANLNTEVEFVPNGYTSALQPMDVGINKPFKGYTRRFFEEWIETCPNGYKPHRRDAAKWVSLAWDLVTPTMIQKTWKKIFKCNFQMDGNEVEEGTHEEINEE
jgi:transposase-like protein